MDRDSTVRGTNDDATVSKLSCAQLGYLKDDFVRHFVRRPVKRAPIINRGYYSRVTAMRSFLDSFLAAESEKPKQVISLGCGFDTTFFQLAADGKCPAKYIELDYQQVTAKKTEVIMSNVSLNSLLVPLGGDPPPSAGQGEVLSQHYYLIPADLRDTKGIEGALARAGFDPCLPTLFIAECVLVYLPPEASQRLVQWCADTCHDAVGFVLYEQIKPDDAFGKQMLINLERRDIFIPGIHSTPSLEAQKARFTSAGWTGRVEALDMFRIHSGLDLEDVQRVNRLEIFDEFEEWQLIQEHYCIAYAVHRDETGLFENFKFKVSDGSRSRPFRRSSG